MPPKDQVKTLEKCVQILMCVAENQKPMALSELILKSGLTKTTSYRLLQSLTSAQLLEKDVKSKKYNLGPKLIYLGVTALGNLNLHKIALPIMTKLRKETGETVNLSILKDSEIVILERIQSNHLFNVNLSVGSRLPAHCTSQGKAMLAYLDTDRIDKIMSDADMDKKTSTTIISIAGLKDELRTIRKKGYAVNNEELETGLAAVAAPIFNHAGEVTAAVNVSYAVVRNPAPDVFEKLSEKVITAAREISSSIGFSGRSSRHELS